MKRLGLALQGDALDFGFRATYHKCHQVLFSSITSREQILSDKQHGKDTHISSLS